MTGTASSRERRTNWKRSIKVTLASVLYYTGVLRLWQTAALRRRAVVLMYHRVLSADERINASSHPGIVVDQQTFEMHMALLKQRFVVLSLEEFTARIEQRRPFPNSSCLITFDDGWRDNLTNALPVLERHALPAVVFLPVNYIGRQRPFWQEALSYLLVLAVREVRTNPNRRSRFVELLEEVGLASVLDVPDADPKNAIIEAVGTRKHLPTQTIERARLALAAELRVPQEAVSKADDFVDWNQAAAMSRRGIAFGGHGAEHLLLTQISPEEAAAEVRASKSTIEARFPKALPTFSYPNGSWSQPIAEMVQAAGYRLAFTTDPGTVTCHDGPFSLKRLNIHEDMTATRPMFLARLVGLF